MFLISLTNVIAINNTSVVKRNDSYFNETIDSSWERKSLYFKNVFSFWYDSYLGLRLRLFFLEQENQMLKDELCLKDNTYSWCR